MKLAILGVGNMGGAILEGIVASKAIKAGDIHIFDRDPRKLEKFKALKINIAKDLHHALKAADVLILAVKPKDASELLRKNAKTLAGKALLSIVAGLTYDRLRGSVLVSTRLLTALPNTPLRVAAGATVFTTETTFTEEERLFAQKLFESVGIVEWVSEKLLFTVTALSGGGPAYTAMFIEALADGAVFDGLPRDTAYRLAAQTIAGTGKMILNMGTHPAVVKDEVCSPAGTTIETVRELEKNNFRYIVMDSVRKSAEKFFHLFSKE